MKSKPIRILDERVRTEFLPLVRQPSRYIGGEINQTKKDLTACDIRAGICFPDIYELGMSHTGLAIIYEVLNSLDDVAAERVFAPWTDAEEIMRKCELPLFTLESRAAVGDLDVVGFTLTNELCYTNMLNMLDLAGIPLRSSDRGEDDPIVIVGGQASNCIEPIADFVDICVLGEGEEAIVELIDILRKCKADSLGRNNFLEAVARQCSFAYVPAFYEFEYEGDRIKSFTSTLPDLPLRFENAIVADLDSSPVPQKPIVPFAEAVHERISIEVMRGCPGRCRFCQASFCRRPVRYRSVERVFEIAKACYEATGFDTISLLSLSTADYPHLEELVVKLTEYFDSRRVGLSLPSMKVQAQLKILPKLVSSVRKGGLTIAVEAASEKLRKVINKPISDEDLFAAISAAYQAGYQRIKLYFMVGLPGETDEDIERIVDLAFDIAKLRKEVDGKLANINVAVSWLVPKPHTPFGWLGQKSGDHFNRAMEIILDRKRSLRARCLQIRFHNVQSSVLESAIARGDRRLGNVIESAWRDGARFDLWSEHFKLALWEKAFRAHGMDMDTAAQREFDRDQILPWQHLGGPGKEYILGHYNEAINTTYC